jgi:hypothetical protein
VGERRIGALRLLQPDTSTLSYPALLIAAAALVAMLRFQLRVGWVLLGGVAAGLVWRLVAA